MAEINWFERSAEEVTRLSRDYTLTSWRDQGGWIPRAVITGGQGCYIWDADGNRYMDFSSQYMCVLAGHQHPKIIQAILDQAQRLCYIDPRFTSHPRAELGRLLVEVTPENLKKVFLCLGGSEANEDALKIAKMYTGRYKFIAAYHTYHGNTHGSSSVSGEARRWVVEPGLPGVSHVPPPFCYRCDFGLEPATCGARCAEYIGQVIDYEGHDKVAAVILEGVIGANGVLLPERDDYLPRVRRICDERGVLLIIDEVMSGFGRTGKWFAVDHWNVQPDIMTMAKGLTSAHLPMGAVAVSGPIAEFFNERRLWLGATYANHPLSAAAAIAAINVYRDERLIENAAGLGEHLKARLKEWMGRHPSIGNVRGIGLFHFIELVKNRQTKENFSGTTQTIAPRGPVLDQIDNELLKRGVSIMTHPMGIMVAPPLCITQEELDETLAKIDEVLFIAADPWVEEETFVERGTADEHRMDFS